MEPAICEHLSGIDELKQPQAHHCDECIKTGGHWVHLRTCQTCGGTHCCDQSPNQHATKHYHATNHPVIISAEAGERWIYCYIDDEMGDY
jgi:uncharacterized UBP type Zn finger protein